MEYTSQYIYNTLISHEEPVSISHLITQRCNARCPHCIVDLKTKTDELSLEQIEKISKTSGNSLRNIAITGGEPFIRDDVFEITDIWHKNSTAKTIALTTNGSMPDKIEEFAKNAAKNNIPVFFFFSYDFIGEKFSEYRKLKDLHLRVYESYKIIKSYGNKFSGTFSITITPDTCKTAIETYKYLRDDLKIENITAPLFRGEKAEVLSDETRKEMASVYKQLQEMRAKDFDENNIGYTNKSLTSILLDAKNKILWKHVLKIYKEKKFFFPCLSASLYGIIRYNGDIVPCDIIHDSMGNLGDFDYNFMECWKSAQANLVRNKIKKTKCFCTSECSMLVNIFALPRFYPELFYYILRNICMNTSSCHMDATNQR